MKLVGGAITILKNMKVNGKDDIPYIMGKNKCSKPPTRKYPFITNNSHGHKCG